MSEGELLAYAAGALFVTACFLGWRREPHRSDPPTSPSNPGRWEL